MIKIDGCILEGGGQILRTALALSTITLRELHIYNIRKKRPQPGLKSQHLFVLKTYESLFGARVENAFLGSEKIHFRPSSKIKVRDLRIDIGTAGSIGLLLQSILLSLVFVSREEVFLSIRGGTSGKWAIPVDYYPRVIFKLLNLDIDLEIKKRGYYPKGGGLVEVKFRPQNNLKRIELFRQSRPVSIRIQSIASLELKERRVAQRQLQEAKNILRPRLSAVDMEECVEYVSTLSPGSEIEISCKLDSGSILWADCLGERSKSSEEVGRDASLKLLEEIETSAVVDRHFADNVIPYLALLGGKIKTSQISLHTRSNIWVCEQFFGNIFGVDEEENTVEVEDGVFKGIFYKD